jgi:DNA-binding PadR family transcriptional regulator
VTKSASREGNRPERYTYQLTPQGEKHFDELLRQNLQDTHEVYFNDDMGFLFLSEIPASEARTCLEQKRAGIDKQIAYVKQAIAAHHANTPAYYTLRHHEKHLNTELEWLDELLAQLKKRAVREDILQCLDAADERTTAPTKNRAR